MTKRKTSQVAKILQNLKPLPGNKKPKPKRSYKGVIDALSKVVKIQGVDDKEALWQSGVPERDDLGPVIRVSVWNLCKGAGGILFEHDYRGLAFRSDLMLTQEALLSQKSLKTFAEPGYILTHAASYKRADNLRDGVLIASRCAPENDSRRIICKYPEPVFKTPKTALVQKFKLSGGDSTLLVINLHATLFRSVKVAQEEMLHLLSGLPDHEGPILFAGDFNTFSARYLKAVTNILSQIRLRHVEIPDDPRSPTQALDQVFVRDLAVNTIKVETSIRNSDHFPIYLEVQPT